MVFNTHDRNLWSFLGFFKVKGPIPPNKRAIPIVEHSRPPPIIQVADIYYLPIAKNSKQCQWKKSIRHNPSP
jgi:hypothetical protein